ncbi:polysaccharide deacetylase family protein [Geobacter sp. DSM 9736]|uniref:polysaccharide deacetylase family protein n=1 Tax=Geobacter sp. DSM 9736 TaxID=1277350 RepID=UPI000B50EA54|nr:polysaccharide deacetylase family protein [Geobacter sp. DSM 9736]SNB48110.1 Peptidoglycan/xylan/chitin deacetylase, PgdA/CDA1 family [Geobacter sp. DSM 9736]
MEKPVIALKVDVDTYAGTRDGVPRLLDILKEAGVRATFYFSMGPDNSGKAIRRVFTRKGFLRKMLRGRAPSAFGLPTMLYGTLLPPPMIGSSFPYILKSVEHMGHEVGIHCWDHVKWHDLLPWMPKKTVAMEIGRACARFEDIFGRRTRTTAAPGWTITADSLEIQDALFLSYSSDARGTSPFYPVLGGRRFTTLQIPTTLPVMDEILGENGITAENINDYYLSLLSPGLNVHTIQAEREGKAMAWLFADLIGRLKDSGATFITLEEAADEFGRNAPDAPLSMGEMPGVIGNVAIQGLDVPPPELFP